ncbi:MAG: SIMPL domain-containing protein [Aggregatilineales bacterium]
MKNKYLMMMMTVGMVVILALGGGIVSAQDDGADYPVNTITVTGTGIATSAPNMATMEVGVEFINSDISAAFSQTNETLQMVIDAVVEQGIAREDIRTTGLSIYSRESFGGMPVDPASSGMAEGMSQPLREYSVSNRVRIVIRDLSTIEDVITAAVASGANNIYGPEFGFSDRTDLETSARENAMSNAQDRAAELAALAGVSVGDIVVINETGGGFSPFDTSNLAMSDQAMGGGNSAVIEPGQLSVTVQVNVTFRINR